MELQYTQASSAFNYKWLLERIYPYIKPFLGRVIIGFLIAIPVGMLDGVVAFALKPYMDLVIGQKNFIFNLFGHQHTIAWGWIAAMIPYGVVFFASLQGVLRYLNDYLTDWTSQKITNSVKIDLFSKLVYMDPSFFDQNSSGMVLSRYLGDPDTASRGIVENIKVIMTSGFGALSLIAIMLYSSWKLALVGVLVLCVAFVPVLLIRNRIKMTSNKGVIIGGSITTNFNETYSGNRVMTAYCLQERQKDNFKIQIKNSFDLSMSLTKRAGWMSPLMYFIASIGIAIVLGFGTKLISSGQMTAGSFASFVTSLLLLYKPVKTLGGTLTGIQGIFVSMSRVFELFDYEAQIQDKEGAIDMPIIQDGIKFENVNFEYLEDKPVLKNISFEVKKGETMALVGNSGGGKTTIINLLPRFYDIQSGAIKIDGIDIRDFKINSLRQNIAMVFQDNFLFSGTIRENILMGNPEASEEELKQAIEAAHLQEMIADFPKGVDSKLGERGTTLSGGQRQRIAIARAMIKNTPIVILDEATSALDNKSEAIVQMALDNLIKNKTVFVIAHRLSTIKNANRIAVINEGTLAEIGTHEELMNIENGKYKYLYEMQFRKQETVPV